MIALLGADAAARAAEEVADPHGLSIANDNSPSRWCSPVRARRCRRPSRPPSELGLRAMILPVTGAFHSPMMASAVPEFEAALAEVEIREPTIDGDLGRHRAAV